PRFLSLAGPTTGLDPRSRLDLWAMVRRLVYEGTTVILTTQYLDEADQLANEIVVVDHGRVIAAGTPLELKSKVGGQVLEVRPSDPATLPMATKILEEFDSDSTIHTDGELVAVTIVDRSALGAVVRRLDDAGISVDDLSLSRPSLDEVFLSLTGRPAEPQIDENETNEGKRP